MSRPPRRLVSLRRPVAEADRARYDALWRELHGAATAVGTHAWRFIAADGRALHLEFLEFAEGSDPRAIPEVASLLQRLDREVAGAEGEEWMEERVMTFEL